MRMRLTPISLVILVLGVASLPVQAGKPVDSVVRIVNYQQAGDWFTPWDLSRVQPSVASGFVIEGGRVLTNAHAVSDSRLLAIFLHNDPEPHVATVFQVAHDCDLALVVPSEPGLLDQVPALAIGGLPQVGSTVETLGYPAGGSQVSSTIGVVSRIEEQQYVHSGSDQHLAGQTDAAINPGNSGGPVVQDGKVVGVAFQAATGLEAVGYFIPTEVITHFLTDAADGRYDGYPDLGIQVASLENEAERRREGIPAGATGVRVEIVWPSGSAQGHLENGDLVLAFEGRPIANDGSVLDGGFRIPFGLLVDRHQVGETVTLQVRRGGKPLDVAVPLRSFPPVAFRSNAFDRLPRYYVYGGLVFVALELETLKTFGDEWYSRADRALLHEFLFRPLLEPALLAQERVVLLRRLDHPVNAAMAWFRNVAVERVNGKRILTLEDLIEAIESNTDRFHVIEFSNLHQLGVLDRAAANGAQQEILKRYGVPKDRRL